MFFRIKPSGGRRYLQIVENKRVDGKVRQVVRLTIGRMDELRIPENSPMDSDFSSPTIPTFIRPGIPRFIRPGSGLCGC